MSPELGIEELAGGSARHYTIQISLRKVAIFNIIRYPCKRGVIEEDEAVVMKRQASKES